SFPLPDLTAADLASLEEVVLAAVRPERRRWYDLVGRTQAEISEVLAREADLSEQRRAVEGEVDPTPASPYWRRDSREGRDGAPFWKLVDFRPDIPDADRAGLEAALEGAGLLDAWIQPDGRVTGRLLDAVLTRPLEIETAQSSLGAMLRPDVNGSEVSETVVAQVLDGLGLRAGDAIGPEDGTMIGIDGTWRIGRVAGRTSKDVAQYIGVAARTAERRRRLAVIDEDLTALGVRRHDLETALDDATEHLERLEKWLSQRPRHELLLRAWATQDAREAVSADRRRELDEATRLAVVARAEAAAAHTELSTVAAVHNLPTSAEGLDARAFELSELARALDAHVASAGRMGEHVDRWEQSTRLSDQESMILLAARTESAAARSQHRTAAAERDELARAEGASLAELDRRLAELRDERGRAAQRLDELNDEHDRLTGLVGLLGHRVEVEKGALGSAEPVLADARASLARLSDIPGVVLAAGVVADDGSAVPLATLDVPTTQAIRAALGTGLPSSPSAKNAVYQGSMALQNGPAATNEPRLVEQDGVLVSVGRDDTGDLPIVELDRRLAASIAQDRDLLSVRERELFEKHILGQLGDALRSVRIKADELVTAMNDQLHHVTTSQGIRVRLRWRLRDDIPAEARRAVELLKQPLGALLPDERAELRGALHALIAASREEAPEESYAGHLARALDYRRWYAFAVQYHRPETAEWRDLQRKSALSQGEQKVLCYLPLFAAAAAHFASLAGAAPSAPRFVLLDDAFPKIDTRTHPLLFGLLVDLDLDFVITSERLWGTHATVPELAIYEALRSPTERGIAQYQHRWDGQRLSAVGA
ncbi:MAG: TIGR02680 family protein, partial [Lapillicoccus sp.]